MADVSIWQLLIIALIVVLLFGTKKLSGIGSDLGSAIKGFKKSLKEDSVAESGQDADFVSAEKVKPKPAPSSYTEVNKKSENA